MSLSSLHVHLVFGTKHRKPMITPDLQPRLHAYLGGIARELNGKAIIVNGTADHVHMLVTIPAKLSVSDAARVLKTNSSKWAGPDFGWQAGYAAFSFSTSNMPCVVAYIRDQDEHHRTRSFEDELVALLKKHGVAYDPAYLCD
jgi:REP element-mobilizing transposase RayT